MITTGSTITLANTAAFQAISSPNYPRHYPNDLDISFIVYSPEGTIIKITFLDFQIEESFDFEPEFDYCDYEEFIIYDGKYNKANKFISFKKTASFSLHQ